MSASHEAAEHVNALLAEMLNTAPVVILIHDDSGRILFANTLASELHGYTPEEFLKLNLLDLVAPESTDKIAARIDSINTSGRGFFEVDHLTRSGKRIPLEVSVKRVEWEGRTAMLSMATDVSERRKWVKDLIDEKEKAEESELKFRNAFNNAGIGMCLTGLDGKLLKTNKVLSDIWGYSEEELQQMTFQDITHPEDLKLNVELLEEAIQGKRDSYAMVKRYIHKSGRIVFAELNVAVVRNSKNEPMFLVTQVQDITKQKQYEEELENNRIKLERIFLVAPTGIGQVVDRVFVDVNLRFCEMTGYTREELIGQNSMILYPTKQDFEYVGNANSGQRSKYETRTLETRFKRKDGKIINVLLASTPMDRSDLSKGRIFTTLDITQLKDNEKQLQLINEDLWAAKEKAEEANRLKTEFLHNMSHEIRTPMNGIIGFSELLNQPGLSDEIRENYSSMIRNSSHQLLKTIDDILEISNLETSPEKLNETEFCFNTLLTDIFLAYSTGAGERNIPVYLSKPLDDNQSFILSDKQKLGRILNNLVENAIKFTNEGYIEIGYCVEDLSLVIYIKDTGIGISPENLEMIFDRFSQESQRASQSFGGLGLGLAIARENALLLGGRIEVDSEKGKGSIFKLILPYKSTGKIAEGDDKSISCTHISEGPYTVLIAEDEAINYLYLESLFNRDSTADYKIIQAKNGKEAVEICTKNGAVDLVLMDIKMPVMNGYEAAERIKLNFPELPIIAQTAYTTPADKEAALSHGCSDFLTKPINNKQLMQKVYKYLKIQN